MNDSNKFNCALGGLIAFFMLLLTLVGGWITNILWTFHQETAANLALGIVGIFVAPVGGIHGIYLWF